MVLDQLDTHKEINNNSDLLQTQNVLKTNHRRKYKTENCKTYIIKYRGKFFAISEKVVFLEHKHH